ncbi:MAG: bile acid:sodium symporter [Bacteroidaceae bacterium]|nr:bile acid:sodium symporter [Bacteroidaceae bacterium]
MLRFLKNWTLPVAIAVGAFFYFLFAYVPELDSAATVLSPLFDTLLPLTIFLTLFVTFSKVDFHLMRLHRWQAAVLSAQLLLVAALVAAALYLPDLLSGRASSANDLKLILEAILICIIAPCASASPVVTAKLGGDLTQMTTFVLLSSLVTSLLIPAVFPVLEPGHGTTFLSAFLTILQRLAMVLLLPLLLGAIVRHWVKPLYRWFVRTPDLGFYCWGVSLAITSGITMKNIVHSEAGLTLLAVIAALTLCTSVVQFLIGRHIGHVYGEHICTGQAMFQKNTGLAIWIAYTYLTPVASIGAGCYVLWQNIINSYELWQHRRSAASTAGTAATPTASQRNRRP